MSQLEHVNTAGQILEEITQDEFRGFQLFIYKHVGIALPDSKKALVAARVSDRVRKRGFVDFASYLRLLNSGSDQTEVETAIDRLTTHETYFFREPQHFEFFREHVLPAATDRREFSVWSAACSTGEEVYSIAMECAALLGDNDWRVLGSDISNEVLKVARQGCYAMTKCSTIPQPFLAAYCQRGVRQHNGYFRVSADLKEHTVFEYVNLNQPLASHATFDVIFLRNVLIYFSKDKRDELVENVLSVLKPGGYLFVGHTELLGPSGKGIKRIDSSIYQK